MAAAQASRNAGNATQNEHDADEQEHSGSNRCANASHKFVPTSTRLSIWILVAVRVWDGARGSHFGNGDQSHQTQSLSRKKGTISGEPCTSKTKHSKDGKRTDVGRCVHSQTAIHESDDGENEQRHRPTQVHAALEAHQKGVRAPALQTTETQVQTQRGAQRIDILNRFHRDQVSLAVAMHNINFAPCRKTARSLSRRTYNKSITRNCTKQ